MKVVTIITLFALSFQIINSYTRVRRAYNPDNLNQTDENYPESTKEQQNFIKHSEKMLFKCLDISKLNLQGENSQDIKSQILNMTTEEKLKAFKNSNCPPLILLPGFMGSKLEFRMKDCKEFQKYHKNILDTCGWNDCEARELKKFTVWVNVKFDLGNLMGGVNRNQKEKVYIPNIITSISIGDNKIDIENKEGCLGNLLRVYYIKDNENNSDSDENYKINYEVTNLKGAEIRLLSTNKQQCGSNIASRMLGENLPSSRIFNAYSEINDYLIKMGYVSGISMFYRPFDFRMPHDNILKEIDRTVKLAYQITKKKPVLIGHSLGGILAYKYSLKNSNLIKEIMAIGSPFLGTSLYLNSIFKLNEMEMEKKAKIFGLDIKVTGKLDKETANLMRVTLHLPNFIPKPYINDEIDKEISKIKEVESLINGNDEKIIKDKFEEIISKDGNKFLKYLYKIFPKINSECNSTFLNQKSITSPFSHPVCKINYKDMGGDALLDFDGELISTNSNSFWEKIRETLKDPILKTNKNVHDLFKLNPDEYIDYTKESFLREISKFTKFKNPKIPFTFVYANHIQTPSKFYFKNNTLIKSESSSGDGTVNSISQIYPGLRWLYEKFSEEEKGKEGIPHPPLHFVEYCAEYKYANISEYDKEKTQYISISCDCLSQHNLNPNDECNHAAMTSDTNLLMFIAEFVSKSDSKVENVYGYEVLFDKKFNSNMICGHLDLK